MRNLEHQSECLCKHDSKGFSISVQSEAAILSNNYDLCKRSYEANSGGETHEVGLLMPNELNLHDMSGNVWEWCQDWFSSGYYAACHQQGTVANPQGPDSGMACTAFCVAAAISTIRLSAALSFGLSFRRCTAISTLASALFSLSRQEVEPAVPVSKERGKRHAPGAAFPAEEWNSFGVLLIHDFTPKGVRFVSPRQRLGRGTIVLQFSVNSVCVIMLQMSDLCKNCLTTTCWG
jgi:hypothetical protein